MVFISYFMTGILMPSSKIIISKIIKFQNRGAVKYALLRRRNVFARYVYARLNGTRKFYPSVTVVHITFKKKQSTSQGQVYSLTNRIVACVVHDWVIV